MWHYLKIKKVKNNKLDFKFNTYTKYKVKEDKENEIKNKRKLNKQRKNLIKWKIGRRKTKMEMKRIKSIEERGITLVALVITIVIRTK